jgi:hypothetical protein
MKTSGTLQPLPIPPSIWTNISMDFIVELPKSGNKSVFMVVVDHLSKYVHFYALQHLFTTSTMAQFFMDNIFKLHEMSHFIVSYCDPTFTNNFSQELFKLQRTQLHLSTTYHPISNKLNIILYPRIDMDENATHSIYAFEVKLIAPLSLK